MDDDVENQDEGDGPRVIEHGFSALLLETELDFCFDFLPSKPKERVGFESFVKETAQFVKQTGLDSSAWVFESKFDPVGDALLVLSQTDTCH